MSQTVAPYIPKHRIRLVTAASLFDGHDAAINIMRRILQASGAEVIHLGHNRSVDEIVSCAIQEDVQAIAITSYQGGHMEFFQYMHDLLKERNSGHIRIFGGGGGVILPSEAEALHAYGIERIYTPDDGRAMGLQGMINDVLQRSDFPSGKDLDVKREEVYHQDHRAIARLISGAENYPEEVVPLLATLHQEGCHDKTPILGITGTGGAGKSSLVDELVRRFLALHPAKTLAIISVDPSRRRSGGALLGDRIRMNAIHHPHMYMRSLATRQANLALSKYIKEAICILQAASFDLIILETSGIGQSDTEIIDHSDVSLYVMTPEYGAASQLEKIDMIDYADVIAVNKFDRQGAQDALRDVRKQYQRNKGLWDKALDTMPVFGTMASHFNDAGVNALFHTVMLTLDARTGSTLQGSAENLTGQGAIPYIIPPARVRYLSEISDTVRKYNQKAASQAVLANRLQHYAASLEALQDNPEAVKVLNREINEIKKQLEAASLSILDEWKEKKEAYAADTFTFKVRDKDIPVPTHTRSLSGLRIPKVMLPSYTAWGDILRWTMLENVPGEYPFTAGVFPFKRQEEDPTRMFAGEGGPERTNKRFHYLSAGMPAARLSTAFDSVTLYGEDPGVRPDIYGKIGNAGVSIATLDDAKRLYSGFDLTDPRTSVSMTINGPAPALMAFFLNTAIDQQCEKYIIEQGMETAVRKKIQEHYRKRGITPPVYQGALPSGNTGLGLMLLGITGDKVLPKEVYERIKADTLQKVRGTVQADILKEDQAQNTCLFSTDFSLKMMGDVQAYFIDHRIRNFYSVSVSGYHIAEAGANPITQLAFTLANGFTYVEYYLSRGMALDAFAPNLSFFFSNGVDPEYSVMGRVARSIWAKAIKHKYGGNDRSQKLKYHIQTSGRSLHAQEIAFNDIRTTLQALYAIYDNCNSLHTNAYDEAITTPTEESVRRAVAIQLIINKELGLAKNENPLQGSFIIEELTQLVEEAVLLEFDRLTERGGVLGAMETMYQRGRIQEESLHYESMKHDGTLPVIGVNTFLSSDGSPTVLPREVIRATEEEKQRQVRNVKLFQDGWQDEAPVALQALEKAAGQGDNTFHQLMETVKYASLGQITASLFRVGGQYRRNM